MKRSEWFEKALAHIESMDPRDLYHGMYGFFPEDYTTYVEQQTYKIEAQYVIDAMNKLGTTQVELYEQDSIQAPSKLFFHYLRNEGIEGVDSEFFGGWGADYLDLPDFNLRYIWVNGQGTLHYFQIIEENHEKP